MQDSAARSYDTQTAPLLNFDTLAGVQARMDPYPYIVASEMLPVAAMDMLKRDFPAIERSGYVPLSSFKSKGSFDALIKELTSPQLAGIVGDKLGIELRDKPCMVTVRKWSIAKDGRIHNDGEAKIVTALLYLNETWSKDEDGGRLRVLRSDKSFDDSAAEIEPSYGTFFAFRRTDNSWHGHKPFAGERRVIQMAWLRSWEDYERKEKRGTFSLFLKKLFPASY